MGAVLAIVLTHFPWLAIALTPFFALALFSTFGGVAVVGIELGGISSAVFLTGALIGLGVKAASKPTGPKDRSV